MKRILCLALALILLLPPLSGCGERIKEPVTFYYLQDSYEENMDSLIVGEEREVAGYQDNLKYLLSFYLMGPVGKSLHSPLPRGTNLFSVTKEYSSLSIEISNTSALLSESEFSLACACLSMTCMDLVGVEEVTVISGSRSLTMRQENLILNDTVKPEGNAK